MHQQEDLEAHTSRGAGSGSNQRHQHTLVEEERQNLETFQRQANHVRQREELEAQTSRGSRSANSEAAAAADYERNRHHENQIRREEEARQTREQEVNQRSHNAANRVPQQTLPKGRRTYHEPPGGPERHNLGPMNVECNHCHALHFDFEKLSTSTRANKRFGGCCLQGQIRLPPFREPPIVRLKVDGIQNLAFEFRVFLSIR